MNLIPRSYIFDDLFDDFRKVQLTTNKCDIYEEENNYIVEMDMPGYSKEEIKVDVEKGYLTIIAEHINEKDEEEKNYIRKERTYGTIKRQFYVGNIDEENIEANFNNGVLKITVPKKEEISNKKEIKIK